MRAFHLIAATALTVLALSLCGCNTMMGMGTDIHDSAQDVHNWIHSGDSPDQVGYAGNGGATMARR